MNLSRSSLKNISAEKVSVPEAHLLNLPEKVLQFGTGVLLRGLPDYFIDKANRQGVFNGRIVVVKSTAQGDASLFDRQDGLYTLCVRGLHGGREVEEYTINSAISRVLGAADAWEQILKCAHDPNMQVIISNTTEVGIQLVNDDITKHPPVSFPGKLLAFLHERFRAFGGSPQSGMVIVPTELIPDNGRKLEAIVLELAHLNGLDGAFIEWLEQSNHFCNSLVDRIVPGKPDAAQQAALEAHLGYADGLMTMSEVYRLWAIEGGPEVKSVLSFAQVDEGVKIEPDIDLYRELKLRLLNGTHTLSCGLAFLAGSGTVKEAMGDAAIASFIRDVMLNELAPAIPYAVDAAAAQAFGASVLDRFRNPFIQHLWINITVQYTSKMKMRCIPVLLEHYKRHGAPPPLFALGFAAYLCFMKAVRREGDRFFGEWNGQAYPIQDDRAEIFYKRWQTLAPDALVREVLQDSAFWGADLSALPGFEDAVAEKLNFVLQHGVRPALENSPVKKAVI